MKLTATITALSLLVICTGVLPTAAQARGNNNNNANQMLIMNNFSTAEQNISNQINTYVSSGQLSPQQGAAFNSELNQISSQAMTASTNSGETMQVMTELNNLTSQINSSLQTPIQYSTVPAYGVANPGFYSNWRNHNYGNFQAQNTYRQNNIQAQERMYAVKDNKMINAEQNKIRAEETIYGAKENNLMRAQGNNVRANEIINAEKRNNVLHAQENNVRAHEVINAQKQNNVIRAEENNIHAHQAVNAVKQQEAINKVKHVEAVEHGEHHH